MELSLDDAYLREMQDRNSRSPNDAGMDRCRMYSHDMRTCQGCDRPEKKPCFKMKETR